MMVAFVFYEIQKSPRNAVAIANLGNAFVDKFDIKAGFQPSQGKIYEMGDKDRAIIVAVLKDDKAAEARLRASFSHTACFGILSCASLSDAESSIRYFIAGLALVVFQPYIPKPQQLIGFSVYRLPLDTLQCDAELNDLLRSGIGYNFGSDGTHDFLALGCDDDAANKRVSQSYPNSFHIAFGATSVHEAKSLFKRFLKGELQEDDLLPPPYISLQTAAAQITKRGIRGRTDADDWRIGFKPPAPVPHKLVTRFLWKKLPRHEQLKMLKRIKAANAKSQLG